VLELHDSSLFKSDVVDADRLVTVTAAAASMGRVLSGGGEALPLP
jgi:hypothetical protein